MSIDGLRLARGARVLELPAFYGEGSLLRDYETVDIDDVEIADAAPSPEELVIASQAFRDVRLPHPNPRRWAR